MGCRHPMVRSVLALTALLTLPSATGCANRSGRTMPSDDGGNGGDGGPGVCGDGVVDQGEECDDGNLLNGDGCSHECRMEVCDPTTCFAGCCTASGDCAAGVQDTECGSGGTACEDCTAAGTLCHQQDCTEFGVCTPAEEMDCGFCGTRYCDSNGAWGTCEDQGECLPDAIEILGSCGNCGQLVRTCDSACTWGTEICTGEGICSAGTVEVGGACGNCGELERTCTGTCIWGDWGCVREGQCPGPGEECCSAQCVDTTSDENNCGTCGHNCGAQESCCSSNCIDTTSDSDHCGSCNFGCNANQQCCSSSCTPYECITAGSFRFAEQQDSWPPDPVCPAGYFTVGTLTELHWSFHRKYTVCVDGAQDGTITTCTETSGSCSPPNCPAGMTDLGVYYDQSNSPNVRQRICLAEAVSGGHFTCTGPIGDPQCDPAQCGAGAVDLGLIYEHYPATSETTVYRWCVVPQCPPSCP